MVGNSMSCIHNTAEAMGKLPSCMRQGSKRRTARCHCSTGNLKHSAHLQAQLVEYRALYSVHLYTSQHPSSCQSSCPSLHNKSARMMPATISMLSAYKNK